MLGESAPCCWRITSTLPPRCRRSSPPSWILQALSPKSCRLCPRGASQPAPRETPVPGRRPQIGPAGSLGLRGPGPGLGLPDTTTTQTVTFTDHTAKRKKLRREIFAGESLGAPTGSAQTDPQDRGHHGSKPLPGGRQQVLAPETARPSGVRGLGSPPPLSNSPPSQAPPEPSSRRRGANREQELASRSRGQTRTQQDLGNGG